MSGTVSLSAEELALVKRLRDEKAAAQEGQAAVGAHRKERKEGGKEKKKEKGRKEEKGEKEERKETKEERRKRRAERKREKGKRVAEKEGDSDEVEIVEEGAVGRSKPGECAHVPMYS